MTQIRTFVSAVNGVGRTTTLLHTAMALVRMGRRVLCVDADPARGLFAAAGLPPEDGGGPRLLPSTALPGLTFWAPATTHFRGPIPEEPGMPAPDWVLIDTASRIPPLWTLPPGARIVVCTDAGDEALSMVVPLLEDLLRLQENHPHFRLDRLLFTRVDWLSRTQADNSRLWPRKLGADAMWITQIRHDRTFPSRGPLQRSRIASPDSTLGSATARLALEWLQSPQSENGRFSDVDSLV